MSETRSEPRDFLREKVAKDVAAGKWGGQVVTRFPPEPNGFLHIGHAKAICISFGIAAEFNGRCNLRFDDTNPLKEETRFVEAIEKDIRWLGYDWGKQTFHASDYFDQLHAFAVRLIEKGLAYVDDLTAEQIREHRGTLTEPGKPSPHRDRPAAESLDLFARMKSGEFPDGSRVLRAKIDMASGNINMRDPVLYRVLNVAHHRTGDTWHIYPMYDFAHPLSDAIEGVTHSLCTLEFEDHRPLYDWVVREAEAKDVPEQTEFARLHLSYTVMSKRALRKLVEENHVTGWDDPRMPTLSAMRRRGYPASAIRDFVDRIGVAKRDSLVDYKQLEFSVRETLNRTAFRVMGVLDPIKVVLSNYPQGQTETFEATNNPENEADGTRQIPFSRELWIERDDFMEDPPRKFFRLGPGREVRLKHAYLITCDEAIRNEAGEVIELRCTVDLESRGGNAPDGRKVRGTLHWVSAEHGVDAEVRLYDHLFTREDLKSVDDPLQYLNPDSVQVLTGCKVEPGLAAAEPGVTSQFMRQGYFAKDPDSTDDHLVFNRTITLKDSWGKMVAKGNA